VADSLTKSRFENYCPLSKVTSQWSDRKKIIFRPLFTSYVFIYVSVSELSEIKKVDGVVNLVYWLGKPAIIRDIEIDMIKRFLNEHDIVQLTRMDVNVNDIVKIINGPLMEKEGSVIEVSSNKVKILLPSLGYSMIAEVAKDNVLVFTSGKNHFSNIKTSAS
jgi:transcription antitermination factor NusG